MWSPKSFGSGRGKSQHTSAETHCPFHISQLSSRLLEIAEESSPFPKRWHPHLITLYLVQPFNILVPSWHFSRKAKKDESGLLFLPQKETHHCAETTWKRGADTGAQLLSVLCHYIFCESVPLLSKHDGNKLSALTRDCMRINFPTSDCSFLTQLTSCSMEDPLQCHKSPLLRDLLCLDPFPFSCPPTLLLRALSVLSPPVLANLNFSNLVLPWLSFCIRSATSPFLFPDGNSILARAFCLYFLKPRGKDGIVTCQDTCPNPSLCKSVPEPFCFNLLFFGAQGSAHSLY